MHKFNRCFSCNSMCTIKFNFITHLYHTQQFIKYQHVVVYFEKAAIDIYQRHGKSMPPVRYRSYAFTFAFAPSASSGTVSSTQRSFLFTLSWMLSALSRAVFSCNSASLAKGISISARAFSSAFPYPPTAHVHFEAFPQGPPARCRYG